MPVEIRELEITAVVEGPSDKEQSQTLVTAERDKIIAECVEQVITILEQKNER
jgi:hypothetical protein